MAAKLVELVAIARPLADDEAMPRALLSAPPADRLWPRPHSALFDFDATSRGADWIDALGRKAKDRLASAAGEIVVAHSDWRMSHLHFEDPGLRLVVVYDWDSVSRERETTLLGNVAHMFTADWEDPGRVRQAPTLPEARRFVDAYEEARARSFTAAERRTIGATFAYACAYSARCAHALAPDGPHERGAFRELVAREGERLLEL
jgi:hypothetical protein